MASFKLTKGTDTFDLDVLGPVKNQAGQLIGKWDTDKNGKIFVKKDAGGTVLLDDVIWKFNSNNQLCLNVGDTEVINFHKVGNRPFFSTTNATLVVRPDQNNVFSFTLRGEWDLSDKHDLSLTINGVTSVIDGFIQDLRGRFMYHFFDKGAGTIEESILGFAGEWNQDPSDPLKLIFKYKRENSTDDQFALAKSITINRTLNQFMYEYDKKGQKFRLQFMGLVKISDDFVISYTLDQQKAQNGDVLSKQTTLTIKAQIDKKDFSGNVEFKVTKSDGTSSSISLRGNFTAIHKKGVKLSVGFAFEQVTSQGKVQTSVAFNGKLEFASGGKVVWTFEKNSTRTSITISATDIALGAARIDSSLNLVRENGQLAGVRVLFGIVL
jgi:tRNA threonylcarbamoyladenosine modification (KEOPS) complex  Pcc1 subunit